MSPGRVVVVLGVAAAIALGGFSVGSRFAAASPPPVPTPSPDTVRTRLVELVDRSLANPTDASLLHALGDLYYQLGEYGFAAAAMEKVLALDPEDVPARLALAAGLFNLGRLEDAEAHWRRVLDVDPDNLEAHYDLGFLYLNQVPPDVARAKAEWAAVLRVAPESDVGRAISEQIALLDGSSGGGLPGPSAGRPSPVPSPLPVP